MLALIQEITGGAKSDVLFRWATLLTGQGVLLAGIIFGYFATRTKVKEVSDQATTAAELAKPTGNGYAKRTEEALSEIKASLVRVESKVDTHIQDHAHSSFKDKNG